MKRIFLITAIVSIFIAPLKSFAQEEPYVDMSTTVEREVTPDEIYLRITIDESNYKGKKTLEQMQDALLEVLKKSRIDIQNSLSLNYMGSEIAYKTFSKEIKPKSEAVYTLKLNNVATMQKVIASLEERLITNIVLARTKYSKENELKSSMGIEAMQQAQEEARTLAGAVGQEIGKAIRISSWMSKDQETQPRLYKARTGDYEAMNIANEEQASQISINKITYRFNVSVRFELK